MKVVFRVFPESKGGGVIAMFCHSGKDCNPGMVESYMHVGQHGEATRHLGRDLRLATPEEYADLKRELEGIYAPEPIVPVNRLVV